MFEEAIKTQMNTSIGMSLFSLIVFLIILVTYLKHMKEYKKEKSVSKHIMNFIGCCVIITMFFGCLFDFTLPTIKGYFDYKNQNFETINVKIDELDSDSQRRYIIADDEKYILIHSSSVRLSVGKYYQITYGKTSNYIINIERQVQEDG